ncbi:hypothetical protein [Catellatospora sp. IY07-71]|uniref:hypothetical protein n=1 Tax=Catellatospora sp. IY07-71 TaxID=2728827 RepID=UPI001BB4387D|nr:hypothetical protein [Catellatospora sp. IY07-71]
MTRQHSPKAPLAALAAALLALAAAAVMLLVAGPAGARPDDRPKHRGYGTHSATPSAAPSTAPSVGPSRKDPAPSKSATSRRHDDGGDDGGDHGGGGGDDELPRTGTSGPSAGATALTGLGVLLLGGGVLWLASALSRRLEGTRLHTQAAGAVAALRRRPSPRPRR